ncbi:hypothetical protein Tcan_09955 [Toxocara canis]|uniref:RNase NYN domain-containing protein n=1 Tax=Toxocara canis TaxID=6265 RepID=A0A0B2V466_TOXCA|nr:hypothetical protein Tcan_09955 [Toxocara canis]
MFSAKGVGREGTTVAGEDAVKRPIILDAMNVMHEATNAAPNEGRKIVDCLSILPIMRYFIRRGHAVHVVIPSFCLKRRNSSCFLNNHFIRELKAHVGSVIEVQHRHHDDLIALAIAMETFGSVVSKDKFRDHQFVFRPLSKVCARNIFINYSNDRNNFAVDDGDKFYPSSFELARFQTDQLYCLSGSEEYELLKEQQLSSDDAAAIVRKLDILMEMAEAHAITLKGHTLPSEHPFSSWTCLPQTLDEYERISIEMARSPQTLLPVPQRGPFMSIEDARRLIEARNERRKNADQRAITQFRFHRNR